MIKYASSKQCCISMMKYNSWKRFRFAMVSPKWMVLSFSWNISWGCSKYFVFHGRQISPDFWFCKMFRDLVLQYSCAIRYIPMSYIWAIYASRYPNLKSVRELIYKRGFGKLNKQRVALTDNAIVEQVCIFLHL